MAAVHTDWILTSELESDERFEALETTLSGAGWSAAVLLDSYEGYLTVHPVPLDARHTLRMTCENRTWRIALETSLHPDRGTFGQHPVDLLELPREGMVDAVPHNLPCRQTREGVGVNLVEWVRIAAIVPTESDEGSTAMEYLKSGINSRPLIGRGREQIRAEGSL